MILVSDNLNTHTKGAFYEAFPPARARRFVRRLKFCHTPKHGRWLNIAKSEHRSLTRLCIGGRRIGDLKTLQDFKTNLAPGSADDNAANAASIGR
ncbi:MAG TPA: transposase [Pirellulales bacterium]|nr:transposase [Pirellulales bacterium]